MSYGSTHRDTTRSSPADPRQLRHPYQPLAPFALSTAPAAYSLSTTGLSAKTPPHSERHTGRSSPGTKALACRPVDQNSVVFISGLPCSQSEAQLRRLLKRYGALVYLEIHPDSRHPGRDRGTARARYKTPSEALDAVRGLDGVYMDDRKISVTQTQDETLSSSTASHARDPERSVAGTKRAAMGSMSSTLQKRKLQSTKTKVESVSRPETARHSAPSEQGRVGSDQASSGSTSPSTGPLVVNGATGLTSRRGSRDEKSLSDDSNDDETDESESDDGDSEEVDDDDDDDDAAGELGRSLAYSISFPTRR